MRAGQFLDLTEAVTEADKATMEREVKAEAAQEAAQVLQEEADDIVREKQAELVGCWNLLHPSVFCL